MQDQPGTAAGVDLEQVGGTGVPAGGALWLALNEAELGQAAQRGSDRILSGAEAGGEITNAGLDRQFSAPGNGAKSEFLERNPGQRTHQTAGAARRGRDADRHPTVVG